MSKLRITALAAALIGAASLTVSAAVPAVAAPYYIKGFGYGSGSTYNAAKSAATTDLLSNYYGCRTPYYLIYDTQGSNGIWSAEVTADCTGLR